MEMEEASGLREDSLRDLEPIEDYNIEWDGLRRRRTNLVSRSAGSRSKLNSVQYSPLRGMPHFPAYSKSAEGEEERSDTRQFSFENVFRKIQSAAEENRRALRRQFSFQDAMHINQPPDENRQSSAFESKGATEEERLGLVKGDKFTEPLEDEEDYGDDEDENDDEGEGDDDEGEDEDDEAEGGEDEDDEDTDNDHNLEKKRKRSTQHLPLKRAVGGLAVVSNQIKEGDGGDNSVQTGDYNVLYIAVSLFEFDVPGPKTEAGYSYLSYRGGEVSLDDHV